MKLASFDIFDTTLIRQCGQPEMIFYLLAQHLYPNDKAKRDDFLLWRKQAETEVHNRIGNNKEVTIEDIYASPRLIAFSSEYNEEELKYAEMEIESEQLIPNSQIKALIKQKREEGYVICFISDMYLPSSFLTQILHREGCLVGNEHVYVSCEKGKRKSDGSLYDYLRLYLSPDKWEHYGDHPISDVKIPRSKGIKAAIIKSGFTEVEHRTIQASRNSACPEAMQWLAGMQRCARLNSRGSDVAEIAADFVAPAYIPYVRFVLDEAVKRGLKRLYFLSRDSYILLEIAKEMQSSCPELEFRYLFVSRKALILPYLYLQTTAEQFLSVQDHETLLHHSVNNILSLLHTNVEELKTLGIQFDYSNIVTQKEEKDCLQQLFSDDSPFLPLLKERAAKEYTMLHDYFVQEGCCDAVECGMVDIGWLGTTRRMINRLQRSFGANNVDFFYYGVRHDVMSVFDGNYISYFYPWQVDTKLTNLIENYFSASPYPSTVGYTRIKEGKIRAVFANDSQKQETELTIINKTVVCEITHGIVNSSIDVASVMRQWMSIAINSILTLSVRLPLGAFLKAGDFDSLTFVRPLTISELFRLCCLGDQITAFDRASLKLTVGDRLYTHFLRMNLFAEKIRRQLYLKMKDNSDI